MLPFRPLAVVFDLDGVLVDSEPIWAEAEKATVEALGGDYTREISELLYGRGHRDGGRLLAERFGGEAQREEVVGAGVRAQRSLRRLGRTWIAAPAWYG